MASRLLVVHLISILCCLCVFGTVQSQGKGRDTARLDKDEVSISDGPGGSCKVIVSSRCCTVDRVVRQVLRVKCECTTGYAAGTTRSQPSCVPDYIKYEGRWCEMDPCLMNETCSLLLSDEGRRLGWECTDGNQVKTTKVTG